MGQESICGLAIDETTCKTIEIQTVKSLDFYVWFLDFIAQLFEDNLKEVPFSLFEAKEGGTAAVVIIPNQIQGLTTTEQTEHGFAWTVKVYTNETAKNKAHSRVLSLVQIFTNFVELASKRKSLTFQLNCVINNSNEATLNLSFRKRI